MKFRDIDDPVHDVRTLLDHLAGAGLEDEGEYGVHLFGRRVWIEHELGDTVERHQTVERARTAFEEARNTMCEWETGHSYGCDCAQCDPDRAYDRAMDL